MKPKKSRSTIECATVANDTLGDPDVRSGHIATAAYFIAEARGFEPGNELEDWLKAEAAYDDEKGILLSP